MEELNRRWRLILGQPAASSLTVPLTADEIKMDQALEALYDGERKGGLGASSPKVTRWLGDIRTYFPQSVVKIMQKDAFDRLGLADMLLQPELLSSLEPDIHLVSTLIGLGKTMPDKTRDVARQVIQQLVDEIQKKLRASLIQAITGSLNRSTRNNRPRYNEIDWHRTIRLNLKHYQSEYKTIIPDRRVGFGRKTAALRDVVICVDQSGSMASSVVYASILAATMATLRSVRTHLVVFDTSIVDLTDLLEDPVEVLFGTQLGGGTDINRALAYCEKLITRPKDTIFILISDLYEGGDQKEMMRRARQIAANDVQFITLLALNDEGAPYFDGRNAAAFASFGVPVFACTPDLFPDMMAAAIERRNLIDWAARNGIVTAG